MIGPFDLLTNIALCFIALVAIMKVEASTPRIETFGSFAITARWEDGSNDDVDLWLMDPSGEVCYFANDTVGLMHLEHDDLGTRNSGVDAEGRVAVKENGERIVIRGVSPGEYITQLHMYNKREQGPARVRVQLWQLQGDDRMVHEQVVTLGHMGEQATAFRFSMNEAGRVSGINRLPKYIAAG